MNNKIGIILLASLIVGILAAAPTSAKVVSYSFDLQTDQTQIYPGIVYSDSIVLTLTTPQRVLCRYSKTKNIPFLSMEGTFDDNFQTIHKKQLTNIGDGVYNFYIRCRGINQLNNNSQGQAELEAIFTVSNPIFGQVSIDEIPLNAGRHEVRLTTSKVPITTPLLTYSYDGKTYNPLILSGSGTSWKTTLLVSERSIEAIGSFKFEAADLESRKGTKLVGDVTFTVDTKKPRTLSLLNAKGKFGQIELTWHNDEDEEDIKTMKIYRSESPGVSHTDLYKEVDHDEEEYIDSNVENGKTYWYRLAAEDEAENIADLSREIQATALLSSFQTTSTTGLDPELHGTVDAFITEIDALDAQLDSAKTTMNGYDSNKQEAVNAVGFQNDFSSAESELSVIRNEAQGYKKQDLSRETLQNGIDASRIKVNILKKKIPQSATIQDTRENTATPSESQMREAFLYYAPEMSPASIDKAVKKSSKNQKEAQLKVKSEFTSLSIIYLDGSTKRFTYLKHILDSVGPLPNNSKVILKLPEGPLEGTEVRMKVIDYQKKEETLFVFDPNTKDISYVISEEIDPQIIDEIGVAAISIEEETSSALTGFFLADVPRSLESIGTALLIIAAVSLTGYFVYMRRQRQLTEVKEFIEKAKEVRSLQKKGDREEAARVYEELKEEYGALSPEEKKQVFQSIKKIHNHTS